MELFFFKTFLGHPAALFTVPYSLVEYVQYQQQHSKVDSCNVKTESVCDILRTEHKNKDPLRLELRYFFVRCSKCSKYRAQTRFQPCRIRPLVIVEVEQYNLTSMGLSRFDSIKTCLNVVINSHEGKTIVKSSFPEIITLHSDLLYQFRQMLKNKNYIYLDRQVCMLG